MKEFKLKRTTQCAKCPWKVSTDPFDIPDGYSVEKHRALKATIAKDLNPIAGKLNIMSCHHSVPEDEDYCVGWLYNQLGSGNNIPLRIKMLNCENAKDIRVVGEQHATFEDTLPENQ